MRCEGEIGREERGDDEGLWQDFWELHLTLKVMLSFDIFSFSCAVTSTRYEQSTSGIRCLWGCVLTASVRAIFHFYQQWQFSWKNCFTSVTWKCSNSICTAHKFTLTTRLGLNDSVNQYCVEVMIMFYCIYSNTNTILHWSRCGSSFAISPQGHHRWDCIQCSMTENTVEVTLGITLTTKFRH